MNINNLKKVSFLVKYCSQYRNKIITFKFVYQPISTFSRTQIYTSLCGIWNIQAIEFLCDIFAYLCYDNISRLIHCTFSAVCIDDRSADKYWVKLLLCGQRSANTCEESISLVRPKILTRGNTSLVFGGVNFHALVFTKHTILPTCDISSNLLVLFQWKL